jgi:hypothetical protein
VQAAVARKSSNTKVTKSQRAREKKHLKRLKELGLYTGDLRRRTTRAGRKALAKYQDVLSRRATVITLPPRAPVPGFLRRRGRKVIVPHAKGERVTVAKTGQISKVKRVAGRTVRKNVRGKITETGRPGYWVIPFQHGHGGPIREQRFSSYAAAAAYMAQEEYEDYDAWEDYAYFEETDAFGDPLEE